eukprot:scaffold24574_cov98-Isochrysis_galbana.AAC.1
MRPRLQLRLMPPPSPRVRSRPPCFSGRCHRGRAAEAGSGVCQFHSRDGLYTQRFSSQSRRIIYTTIFVTVATDYIHNDFESRRWVEEGRKGVLFEMCVASDDEGRAGSEVI